MAKIYSYTVMLAVLLAVLNIGFNYQSTFLGKFNFTNPSTWASSYFLITLMGIIVGASVIGITASYFGRSPSESYILGVATTFGAGGLLILGIAEFGGIVQFMINNYPDMKWLTNVISVVFFGIIAGYTIALVQFWRGNDI